MDGFGIIDDFDYFDSFGCWVEAIVDFLVVLEGIVGDVDFVVYTIVSMYFSPFEII